MKIRITRISPTSLATIMAASYFVIGILIAIFGILGSLSGATITLNGPFTFTGTGVSLIFVSLTYPFIAALFGFIGGLIFAWFYNFIADYTKGLLVEFKEADKFDT